MSRMLYTVGPVNVSPDTLQSMTKPMITHRSAEYKELHGNIVEKIKKALDTDMDVFLIAGSATAFNEGAIRNGKAHRDRRAQRQAGGQGRGPVGQGHEARAHRRQGQR